MFHAQTTFASFPPWFRSKYVLVVCLSGDFFCFWRSSRVSLPRKAEDGEKNNFSNSHHEIPFFYPPLPLVWFVCEPEAQQSARLGGDKAD